MTTLLDGLAGKSIKFYAKPRTITIWRRGHQWPITSLTPEELMNHCFVPDDAYFEVYNVNPGTLVEYYCYNIDQVCIVLNILPESRMYIEKPITDVSLKKQRVQINWQDIDWNAFRITTR